MFFTLDISLPWQWKPGLHSAKWANRKRWRFVWLFFAVGHYNFPEHEVHLCKQGAEWMIGDKSLSPHELQDLLLKRGILKEPILGGSRVVIE